MSVLLGSDAHGVFVDGAQEAAYVAKVLALSPIAYWTLGEHSGADAICQINRNQNGTHTAVTLGNAGIGDGQVCPFYDGAGSYTSIYSATLAAAFNGSAGSVMAWTKVANAGAWTDGTARMNVLLLADANNFVRLNKNSANNQVTYIYEAGGTLEQRNKNAVSTTDFYNVILTWDSVADEVKAYYNGAQEGATMTGLGAWVGALSSTRCLIGANTQTPTNVTHGYNQHVALWASALTPAQVSSLATV